MAGIPDKFKLYNFFERVKYAAAVHHFSCQLTLRFPEGGTLVSWAGQPGESDFDIEIIIKPREPT